MRIEIRQARDSDEEFARRTHHAAYREVVERQFGPWDETQQDLFFEAAWEPDKHDIIVADGQDCGYCVVERRVDDIHVRELVVQPRQQGRGIGTSVLRGLQGEAAQRLVPVRLGTFRENHALRLYARLGFREIGHTDTHVLMEWRPQGELEEA